MDFKKIETMQIVTALGLGVVGYFVGKKLGKGSAYAHWLGAIAGVGVGFVGYSFVFKKEDEADVPEVGV